MKNGTRVVVVRSRGDYSGSGVPFPPVGSVGTVVSGLDKFREVDVEFDGYPCPGNDSSWITHFSMIVVIGDDAEKYLEVMEEVA